MSEFCFSDVAIRAALGHVQRRFEDRPEVVLAIKYDDVRGIIKAAIKAEREYNSQQQRWLPVVGYETQYEVSENGDIRRTTGESVGLFRHANGYMRVRFSNPRWMAQVHRIVAQAFIPNPLNLPYVNHIDSIRDNNHVSNLEWGTQEQNTAHAAAKGRLGNYWRGKRAANAKFSESQIIEIKKLYACGELSCADIAKKLNVAASTIVRIISGKRYAEIREN